MPEDTNAFDDQAQDDAAEHEHVHHPRQNAGQDESIAKRLERNPESKDAVLDSALDESMDASDPPATTQPGDSGAPPKSSGYDPDAEARLVAGQK